MFTSEQKRNIDTHSFNASTKGTEYPLVTIITCTYNDFSNIFETIKSVLFQDYPNIEYILTDDGSEKFPKNAIEDYINKHKKENLINYHIIHHEQNLGTVRNANYAMAIAKGAYIAQISGDDQFFCNNVISNLVVASNKLNCRLIVSSRIVCNSKGKQLYFLPHLLHRRKLLAMSKKEQYDSFISGYSFSMASGSVFFIKRVTEKENVPFYDEKYLLWEDGPFIEKYLRNEKIGMAYDIISIFYRNNGVSSSKSKNSKSKKLLIEDLHLFSNTDRISLIENVNKFCVRLLKYNMSYPTKYRINRITHMIKNVDVILYKAFYKLDNMLNKYIDKIYLKFIFKHASN